MKVRFLNAEQTAIELTTGMWWWKRVAWVRRVPFEERYNPEEGWTDPVRYRYVNTNNPVPDMIVSEIYLAIYYAEQKRHKEDWRKP